MKQKVRAEADMDNALKILDGLKKDLAGKQPSGLEITFSWDDTRLSVIEAGGKYFDRQPCGLELGDGGPTDVVGVPIQEEIRFGGKRGPDNVLIYGHLSASTLVDPFWEIAERFGHRLGNHERF